MRIALTGAHGQLGTQLQHTLKGDVIPLGHDRLDISNAETIETVLASENPDLVINAAAYNFVDRAEDEPQVAYRHNALGPRNLALYCEKHEIPLLHFSTDYVFSGRERDTGKEVQQERPYLESDLPGPKSAYAVSKLAGEYFVRTLCRRHFVLRTCGLYGRTRQQGTGNFVETMLRLGSECDELTIVNDQCCTPTSCSDLADAVQALIETDAFGMYHATNAGSITWYEFAVEIFRLTGIDVPIRPISSEQFGAAARRPIYSVLDNAKLSSVIGKKLPDWQDALDRYLKQRET
jgi:dTDP-4-dehydrorhamnose reductase